MERTDDATASTITDVSDRCISRTREPHYREAYATTAISHNDGLEWNKVSE